MRRLLGGLVVLFALASPAHAQLGFDSLKALWTNKQYHAVIKPLVTLRASAPAEQLLTIDYMIATAHCRLPGAADRLKGRQAFDAMLLYHYRVLNGAQQQQLTAERNKCAAGMAANPSPPRYVVMASRRGPARATYSFGGGKQYYDICGAAPGGRRGEIVAEGALEGTRSLPVWTRAQLAQARAAAEQLLRDTLGTRGNVRARDGIVIASMSGHSDAQIDTILDALLRYRDYYVRTYALPLPDTVLQVFLAPSMAEMFRLARALHGLQLDRRLIGYSSLSDMSMVAIIPRTIYGTLMHELMHLLYRNQVPNAAPWLDEGLAALYEVSRSNGNNVVGIPNWRGQILHRVGGYPPLERLLELNWTAFEGGGDPGEQARNHALARYFVLYLQEKGKLADVVRAVSARPPLDYQVQGDDVTVISQSGRQTLELIAAMAGLSPGALQADFERWLRSVVQQGWAPC